jgi:TetR/AcrR family transcriptional repressor of nem operon
MRRAGVPRTRDFEPAKTLDRVVELFWRNGYSRVSFDDLVRHTGVHRYGLYATFGDKHDLFLEAIERYSRTIIDPMIGHLEDPQASLGEIRVFFTRVLGLIRRTGDGRGCLICNTAVELGPFDRAVRERTQQHFGRVRALLKRALTNARRRGESSRSTDATTYADYLLGVEGGMFWLARSGVARQTIRRYRDTALEALNED